MNSRGSPGAAAQAAACDVGELGLEPLGAQLELGAGVLGRQPEQDRQRGDELGVLALGRREHLAQPLLRDLAPGVGDGVDDAVGIALDATVSCTSTSPRPRNRSSVWYRLARGRAR